MRQLLPQNDEKWIDYLLKTTCEIFQVVALYAFRVWPCNHDLVRLVIPVNTTNLPERSNTWSRCSEQMRWEERRTTTEDGVNPNGETGGPVKVRKTSSYGHFCSPDAKRTFPSSGLGTLLRKPCNILRTFTGCPVVSGYIWLKLTINCGLNINRIDRLVLVITKTMQFSRLCWLFRLVRPIASS